jgi:TPR repeat protein
MWSIAKFMAIALSVSLTSCSELTLLPDSPADRSVLAVLAGAETAHDELAPPDQQAALAEHGKKICLAANKGSSEAQAEIARLHWHGLWEPPSPFNHDLRKAYIWTVIALRSGQPVEDMEELLGSAIYGVERWRLRELAYAWEPNPAQCENMEKSVYFSIPGNARSGPTPEEILIAARAGEARAAFLAYRRAATDAQRRKWICIAANRGSYEAQTEIARLHSQSSGNRPGPFAYDLRRAYIWSVIAVRRRLPLDDVERQFDWMIAEGKWRAIALAVSWKPDPDKCEDIEDSEYYSLPKAPGA